MPSDLEIIQAVKAKESDSALISRLKARFSSEDLASGKALAAHGGDFVWVLRSSSEPHLYVDDRPAPSMRRLDGSELWIHSAKLLEGWAHAHYYRVGGSTHGDRVDTAALTVDSYPQAGVPEGNLSEMMVHESAVYHGYRISWWVYASPGTDPETPSPSMVWHDGQNFLQRDARDRLPVVTENLVHQKRIPPMVHILLAPTVVDDPLTGKKSSVEQRSLRSLLYDSVNDDYNKMVFGEIFPKVERLYKLRSDGYSTGTCGQSSGGICAFNMGWQRPERVSRLLSRIGTFTSIQWRYGQDNPDKRFGFQDPAGFLDGGNLFPFLLRKRPRKNLRVYLSDGSYDLENAHGSWPLQNIQMANSLKMQEYDFKFVFGNSQHNTQQGAAELPAALSWLWRDYDPAKTEQVYQLDPDEKEKPYYRVAIVNR